MDDFISRRTAITLLGSTALWPAMSGSLIQSASAQGRALDIRGGSFRPVPIAISPLAGDPELSRLLTKVITNNFSRSVYLTPLPASSFPEKISNPGVAPQFDRWRTISAQYLVTGRAGRGGDGRLRTEFRLWDITRGQQIAGQQYVTDANNSRRVAHIISDAIFSKISGEKGFFDTRVVFVDERGPKQKRQKRLAIMDQDGANVRFLTSPRELVVTPRFSPNSQDVTYMSFGRGDPRVYLMSLDRGQREVVGNFPGMTFSPRFSPDGQKIIMSLSTQGIDTSPSYAPDGSRIVFESDRGGSQQLYVMGAGGGAANRISFGAGARYSTPVWSPKGDYIAFTRQKGGAFAIGVMKPDGSGERIITEGFHNEGPTWAPNGLYVMFFRDPGGAGGPHIYMANVTGRGEFRVPTPGYASDPSWSPLLR
ncbi:MAG: Tol-Pal system protein TolB [Beijerinckiaceae bacterium]|nr:Tol-Pal system protein TolB [Beijerinckiaceae bacterium]